MIRHTNRDFVFNETESKCTLSFNVEAIDVEINDQGLIMLAIDALASIIENSGHDPKIIFDETLKSRILN